ncbi:MAG TPA: hypothetical protein VE442_01025, partial [Jatrophihabitans sp.]|nr:hypothetical protein [Jatrophihabitans sp.]
MIRGVTRPTPLIETDTDTPMSARPRWLINEAGQRADARVIGITLQVDPAREHSICAGLASSGGAPHDGSD